jgi:hypothetical protein
MYKIKRAGTNTSILEEVYDQGLGRRERGRAGAALLILGKSGGRLMNKGGGILYEKWFWF